MADLLVLGPRKRKLNSCFADDGDAVPLSNPKRIKPALNATAKHVPRIWRRHTSVQDSGDEHNTEPGVSARSSPLESVQGSDGEEGSGEGHEDPIDVDGDWDEPFEESAEDELGERQVSQSLPWWVLCGRGSLTH